MEDLAFEEMTGFPEDLAAGGATLQNCPARTGEPSGREGKRSISVRYYFGAAMARPGF